MGRHVAEVIAQRLGRTILELGGNNGIIVMDDANPDLVLRAVLFGAVGTAGQRCTTTRRLFLQRGIAPRITEALVRAYGQVHIGDPLDEHTIMGPLINRRAVDDMLDGLRRIREQGGEILSGGERARRLLRAAHAGARPPRHADPQGRDLRADSLPGRVRPLWTRPSTGTTTCRRACRRRCSPPT